MKWVVRMMLTPAERSCPISSQVACLACGSMPAVGSSRNTSSGRPVTAPGAALSVSPSTAVVWPYRLTSPPISTAGVCGTVLTDASLRRQQRAQRGGVDDLRPPREDPAQQDIAGLLVGVLGAVGKDVEAVVAVGCLGERGEHHAAGADPGREEGVGAAGEQVAGQAGA